MGYDPRWTPEQLREYKDKRNAMLRAQRAKARQRKDLLEGAKPEKAKNLTSREKRNLYLSYIEKGAKRQDAAEAAGVKYSTVLYWRKSDEAFRNREIEIQDIFLDKLEDTLRVALEDRGTVRDIVDILERKRPTEWAKQVKSTVEHNYNFEGSNVERLARIEQLMIQARRITPELEMPILDVEVVED